MPDEGAAKILPTESSTLAMRISLKTTCGKWTYEIRGDYTAPGTANTWTGKAVTGTFFCPPNPN